MRVKYSLLNNFEEDANLLITFIGHSMISTYLGITESWFSKNPKNRFKAGNKEKLSKGTFDPEDIEMRIIEFQEISKFQLGIENDLSQIWMTDSKNLDSTQQ
jgi:hypothetical protein